MRSTTWRLFQKLAGFMQISMERAPVPAATFSHSSGLRNFRHAGGRRARERMLAYRRAGRATPRSQLRGTIRDMRNEPL